MKTNHLYLLLLVFLMAGPVLAKSKIKTKTIVPERVINVDFNNEKGALDTMFKECIGVKPFVELGFMPAALASGKQTIFWWRGNVTPPKDYKKWEDFIRNLTQHFTERYGVDEVKTWYFEVWNEPNLTPGFWTGTQEEYFKLYKYAVHGVKSVNADYKVGGPGTAGAAWESEMIEYCTNNNVPIDFISTHSYGVKQGFLDEFGLGGTVLSKDSMSVSGDVLQSRKEIEASAKKKSGIALYRMEFFLYSCRPRS